MLEVISKIREQEAAAEETKRRAYQTARDMEAKAQADGREAVAKAKSQTAEQAAGIVACAQKEADQMVADKAEAARKEGERLTTQAEARLDSAAKLIVERIVEAQ